MTGNRKLSSEDIAEIEELLKADSLPQWAIAERYEVSQSTISTIRRRCHGLQHQPTAQQALGDRPYVRDLLRRIAECGSSEDYDRDVILGHIERWRAEGETWWTCATRLNRWGFRRRSGRDGGMQRWTEESVQEWMRLRLAEREKRASA